MRSEPAQRFAQNGMQIAGATLITFQNTRTWLHKVITYQNSLSTTGIDCRLFGRVCTTDNSVCVMQYPSHDIYVVCLADVILESLMHDRGPAGCTLTAPIPSAHPY